MQYRQRMQFQRGAPQGFIPPQTGMYPMFIGGPFQPGQRPQQPYYVQVSKCQDRIQPLIHL